MTALPPQLAVELVPTADLQHHPDNPRSITAEQRASLRAALERAPGMLWARPLIRQQSTGYVIAGNQRLLVAREDLAWPDMPAVTVDLDERTAREWAIVDNNGFGDYDDRIADYLRGMEDLGTDLSSLGFDEDELAALLGSTTVLEPGEGGDTDPGEVPTEPVTQLGDRIVMGDHVLVCGDSTRADHLDLLMAGGLATMMWTDPPYGVSYVGKTKDALTIQNDGAEGLDALLRDAFAMADTALEAGAPIYIAHPPGALCVTFGTRFIAQGWRFHQTLVWVKDSMVLGHSDYHFKHEPLIFGYKPGEGRRGRGGTGWHGDDSQVSVFEIAKPSRNESHPTMKPTELIEAHLTNSSQRGAIVLDIFGGSGSTLIAAENLGRTARLMELDPGYCDVIIDRWQRHTGKTAQRPG